MAFHLDEDEWIDGYSEASGKEQRRNAFELIGRLEAKLDHIVSSLLAESNHSTERAIEQAKQLIKDGKLKPTGNGYSTRLAKRVYERDDEAGS